MKYYSCNMILPGICLLKRFLMEFNCLKWIPVYIHSANIPISLHFLSRHSWHFLRMYMSITQLPPFLHLYTAFLVMLLLKKPVEETLKNVRRPLATQENTSGAGEARTFFSWTGGEQAPSHSLSAPVTKGTFNYTVLRGMLFFNLPLTSKNKFQL